MILMIITSSFMYWWWFKQSIGINNGYPDAIFISHFGRWNDELWGSAWNVSTTWSSSPWSKSIMVIFFWNGQIWRSSLSPFNSHKNPLKIITPACRTCRCVEMFAQKKVSTQMNLHGEKMWTLVGGVKCPTFKGHTWSIKQNSKNFVSFCTECQTSKREYIDFAIKLVKNTELCKNRKDFGRITDWNTMYWRVK